MKKLQEGWNEVQGTDVNIFVEDGKVIRATVGYGVYYHTVYPYKYSSSENAYENISGISVENYEILAKKNRFFWH